MPNLLAKAHGGRWWHRLLPASLAGKLAAVVCLTVVVALAGGFFAGRAVLERAAGLAQDASLSEALTAGQKALAALHKERQARVEPSFAACFAAPGAPCQVPGVKAQMLPAVGALAAGWESETVYVSQDPSGRWWRLVLGWDELRPSYTLLTEVIGTHEHVDALLPALTHSFLTVFAGALLLAGGLGLCVTYLLGRRLTARMAALTDYARTLGRGLFVLAPPTTLGRDDVGALAGAMQGMAQDLVAARERLILAEKMASWQNVARKVAHEIKNPLTPLSLVADELARLSGERHDAGLGEMARVLSEETESLGRMVKEFSAFARLPEADLQRTDLTEVVRDFAGRIHPQLEVSLQLPRSAVAMLDRGMIHQILHNLTNNARLAKSGGNVKLTISLRAAATQWQLDFCDNGCGVPEALRTTLFDAYVTSRSTGDGEKGMGLGLAISRKIAVDHGGRLDLVATGPSGSTFRLTLPCLDLSVEKIDEREA